MYCSEPVLLSYIEEIMFNGASVLSFGDTPGGCPVSWQAAVKTCSQTSGPLHCRVTGKAQHASHSMQMELQQHQHCIALLSHKESGASQHHTAVTRLVRQTLVRLPADSAQML